VVWAGGPEWEQEKSVPDVVRPWGLVAIEAINSPRSAPLHDAV
jgi:hypothetical protein